MIETYIPLYRKYRPSVFSDVVGQGPIVQALTNAIELNRVAHAYLLCGPRGTGKTSTARIFAKSLNCEQGPTVNPCGTCASCQGMAEGMALDIIEFDAASNNGVDDARELIESCQFAPINGRYKVYIIDEVHMLTTQAFNTLLKTLEEPPPNVIFIFATTEAHKVLPTIISRCQRFDFHRITNVQIKERLQYIAKQEEISINEDALNLIARHAKGGLRDAVGLLDQVGVLGRAAAHQGQPLGPEDVIGFTGTLTEERLFQLTAAIAERQVEPLVKLVSEVIEAGVEPAQILKDCVQYYRDLMLTKASTGRSSAEIAALLEISEGTATQLIQHAGQYQPEEFPQIIEKLTHIDRDMRFSQDPKLWLEMGLVSLAFRHDIAVVQDLAKRLEQLENQIAAGIPAGSQPSAPVPSRVAKPALAPPSSAMGVTPVQAVAPAMAIPPSTLPVPTASVERSISAATEFLPPPRQTIPSTSGNAATGGALSELHQAILQKMASPPTKALFLQHTHLCEVTADKVVFGSASSTAILTLLNKPDKQLHLQKAVEKHFGKSLSVQIIESIAPLEGSVTLPLGEGLPVFPSQSNPMEEPSIEASPTIHTSVSTTIEPPPKQLTEPPVEKQQDTDPVQSIVQRATEFEPDLEDVLPENPIIPDFPPATQSSRSSEQVSPMAGNDTLEEAKKNALKLLNGKIMTD